MKFGREFRDRLASEGYPEAWQQRAFPYRALKKSLHGVQSELTAMGLDPDTLNQLLGAKTEPSTESTEDDAVPVARFDLEDPTVKGEVLPRLTVILELEDGVPVNSSLSPSSRQFLQKLAASKGAQSRKGSLGEPVRRLSVDSDGSIRPIQNIAEACRDSDDEDAMAEDNDDSLPPNSSTRHRETIELEFENHRLFFDTIQRDLKSLDALEKSERQKLEEFMDGLHKEITAVIRKPRKLLFRKSDLTLWRQIFEVYMEAQVFFARGEVEHGTRDRPQALRQLQWFQTQVQQKKLIDGFQLEGSRAAYERFLELNKSLVVYSAFQEMNKEALGKILKKFHKRTQLNVSDAFLGKIHPDFMASEIATALCVRVTEDLVTLIPPLNEYLCPVCYEIAWLPMYLPCKHLFCVRCVVKMQQRRVAPCPECREPVVLKAYLDGIDANLVRYLERYYPDKCREKEIQDRNEMGQELWGPEYRYKGCNVM